MSDNTAIEWIGRYLEYAQERVVAQKNPDGTRTENPRVGRTRPLQRSLS